MVVSTRRSQLRGVEAGGAALYDETPESPGEGRTKEDGGVSMPVVMNGSDEPCLEGEDSALGSEKSDEEGPDVEVAADAQKRAEELSAAELAAKADRKAKRREQAKAKERASQARKEARKKRVGEKLRANSSERELPEEVLQRAAYAMEEERLRARHQAVTESLKAQSGTLRVAKRKRFVDGLEVVDARLPAAERAGTGRKKNKAVSFLNRCMYGTGPERAAKPTVPMLDSRRLKREGGIRKRGRSRKQGR